MHFSQLRQCPAKSTPDHVRPLPLEPKCAFFSICRITAEKSCSAPSSDCLALISKAASAAGIRAPTDAAFEINARQSDEGAEQDFSAVILQMEKEAHLDFTGEGRIRKIANKGGQS